MKPFQLCATFVAILFLSSSMHAFKCSYSHFTPRPQETDQIRRLQFWDRELEPDETCYSYWLTPGFMRSFRACRIAQYFFGSNNLTFSGSRVEDRGEYDILADYLGLPSDFKSKVCFKPVIKNFFIDSGLKINLECICEGMYLEFYAPLVHTR